MNIYSKNASKIPSVRSGNITWGLKLHKGMHTCNVSYSSWQASGAALRCDPCPKGGAMGDGVQGELF